MVQVISIGLGLATLAFEQIYTHLQRARNEAMMKGLAILRNKNARIQNFVTQFESDFIMYGRYNVENLDHIQLNLGPIQKPRQKNTSLVLR
jgi:hypothetical protein